MLLTKSSPRIQHPPLGPSGDQVADHLQRQAVRRLELVALVAFAAQLGVWLAVNLVQGSLAEEFSSPLNGDSRLAAWPHHSGSPCSLAAVD